MVDTSPTVAAYLTLLGEALELLGPEEAAETVAEIRGHIAEAIEDFGGDEQAALARFGRAEVLAARILEERGIVAGGHGVPEAPASTKALVLLIDACMWIVALMFASVIVLAPLGSAAWSGAPSTPLNMIGWVAAALALGASVWWWAKGRLRPGRSTTGMQLAAVRLVRVGNETRMVRIANIPGAAKPRRAWPAVRAALALYLVTVAVISTLTSSGSARADLVGNVANDASTGTAVVSSLYQQVEAGANPEELAGSFAPGARSEAGRLVERRRNGRLASYAITSFELPGYAPQTGSSRPADDITVTVHVLEYAAGSDTPNGYRYTVRVHMEQQGDGISSGAWLVESIDPESQ